MLFTKANGFYHESISSGIEMFQSNGTQWGIELFETDKSSAFTEDNLQQYQLIVFLNNTGNLFSDEERLALQSYIRKGGAILGIHAATDAEYDWPWYGQMLGARFKDHPAVQEAICNTILLSHPSVQGMPEQWLHVDEWYNFSSLASDNHTVLTVDENSYIGGSHGAHHPVSWYREFEGGKIFYTAMGHNKESYQEPIFVKHIAGAVEWLIQP
ncbi:MAG: ThuA domain-containing protein [Bacteroidota bacterium]